MQEDGEEATNTGSSNTELNMTADDLGTPSRAATDFSIDSGEELEKEGSVCSLRLWFGIGR